MRFRKWIRAAKSGVPLMLLALASDSVVAQFREVVPQTQSRPAESRPVEIQLAPTRQPFITPRDAQLQSPPIAVPEPVATPPIEIHSIHIKPFRTSGPPTPVASPTQLTPIGVQLPGEPTLATGNGEHPATTSVVVVELTPKSATPAAPTAAVPKTADRDLKSATATSEANSNAAATQSTVTDQPTPTEATVSETAPEEATLAATKSSTDTAQVSVATPDVNPPSQSEPEDSDPAPSTTATDDSETETAQIPSDPFSAFGPQDPAAASADASSSPTGLVVASPVAFNRVVPGESTVADVTRWWGQPARTIATNGGQRLIYRAPGFAQVDLATADDRVESTLVHLAEPVELSEIEGPLNLGDARPVKIDDADGQPLGYAYPERGVLLTFAPGTEQSRVSHVLLEPLRGELYRLRAELDQRRDYSRCLADLAEAVRLDPQDARAYWLQAELLSWAGQSEDALDCVRIAIRIDPDNPLYQLTQARFQAANGEASKAMATTQEIAEATATPEIVRARAEYQWGNLLANGPEADYMEGLAHHMKSIDIAAKFLNDRNHDRRRMAKDVVVDAHLAIAQDIALGNFQRQREVVPKWLTRATELAEAFIAEDGGDPTIRMEIYRTTLAVYGVMDGNFDASIATEEAMKESRRLIAEADDRMYQSYVERELAETLFHAAKVEHRCDRSDAALRYANNAIVLTESSDEIVQPTPFDRMMRGQLYFFAGSVYAVHKQDHQEAAKLYDKALPAFDDQRLVELVDTSAFGELFVSMGVSYWETGQKQKAIQLTEAGAELMQQGVQAGTIDLIAMSVPYGNLAAMHRDNGNQQQANHFSQMMAKVEKDGLKR